jgi:hypothetical protein
MKRRKHQRWKELIEPLFQRRRKEKGSRREGRMEADEEIPSRGFKL